MASIPQTFYEILSQVVVQVEINGGKVYVSPEEVTIYNPIDDEHATPGRAREVRWVVKGHGSKQYVRIVPLGADVGMFDDCKPQKKGETPCFEIPPGYNSIASGQPRRRANAPADHTHWYYEVQVVEKVGGDAQVVLPVVDPDIIIKDDP